MKVLVTGATGFVGQEVVRAVCGNGHSVRVLARHPASPTALKLQAEYGVELRAGDVLDEASLAGAMEFTDAVIHLVGIISECGDKTFQRVHAQGTRNVLAAARAQNVKRYVHMSALGTRLDAASRYHQSKWAAEESVRRSSLAYTIFRPSLIYGNRDHFVNLFARLMRFSPLVPVMGDGCARFQPVAVEDVAKAFSEALTQDRASAQTYDLCGPEPLTFNELLDTIAEVIGKRRWKLHVPFGLARGQAALLEWIFPRLLRQAPPFNRDQLTMLQEGNAGNPQPAVDLFHLSRETFRAGISRYLHRAAHK